MPTFESQALPATRKTIGRVAETAAMDHYIARGFSILARNVRLGYLEVDFVARDGGLVVLVEVRTRSEGSYETAFGSVSLTKRGRLRTAMERYWANVRDDLSIAKIRVDCAAVVLSTPVRVEVAEGIV